jgi:hypothetical protein
VRFRLSALPALGPLRAALAVAVVGLVVRLWVVLHSIGSNDAYTWETFGELVLHGDLLDTYRVYKSFNHPPLMGYLAMLAYDASRVTGVRFQVFFKLVPLASDLVTGLLLASLWRQKDGRATAAAALWAGSLVAVLASAYHCNTDSLCACLCLVAAVAWDRGRYLGAGLALGAALNVKLIPAPLVLVLALQARDRRALARYAGGLALAALPFVPVLCLVPRAFFRNAIAYNSLANPWGLVAFLEAARETPRFAGVATRLFELVRAHGRYLVFFGPLVAAVVGRRRGWSAQRTGAITLGLFLVVTPGFSVHYLIYPAPLLFAMSLRAGTIYSVLAGATALSCYVGFWTGTTPWFSDFAGAQPRISVLLGVATWTALVTILVKMVELHPRVPQPLPAGERPPREARG